MSQGSGFFSNEQLLCLRSQIMVFRTLKACHLRSGVLCRDIRMPVWPHLNRTAHLPWQC